MQLDDTRNLEVFQLCCDIIDRTSSRLVDITNDLHGLLPIDTRKSLCDEGSRLIADISPCFKKASTLQSQLSGRLPYEAQKPFKQASDTFDAARRMFNIAQQN
ncbi:hypothetical protein LJB76_02470 [Clostridia bacterium OttesenSCG-928-O13]|nr:hypothetical protein [Clostridia bacterium OttesenSCG-928-O13]